MSGLKLLGFALRCGVNSLLTCALVAGSIQLALAQDTVSDSARGHMSHSRLSLDDVLYAVKKNDFGLKRLQEESYAYEAESDAASYLPDPTLFAAIQSLPTDTFEFDQEPMTQLRFGIKQMLPKGDSLEIKSNISTIQSELALIDQKQRWLERKKQTEQAWLEAWFWQKNLSLLEEDESFLVQIQKFINSLYEVGAKDQSDVIGADLELIKLKEKRLDAQKMFQMFMRNLNTLANEPLSAAKLVSTLPDLQSIELEKLGQGAYLDLLRDHPRIQRLQKQVFLSEKKVDLVNQDFEPSWGFELSVGLRNGENMDGSDRPDFLYAGVNLQMPLFSKGRQQQNTVAARQRTNVAQINRDEALSQMRFEIDNLLQQYRYSKSQRELYETDILSTLEKQAKSALQSYESDQEDLELVLKIFLKKQSAKSMYQRLRVNEQKLISSLNYLLGLGHKEFTGAIQTKKQHGAGDLL